MDRSERELAARIEAMCNLSPLPPGEGQGRGCERGTRQEATFAFHNEGTSEGT